MQSPALDRLVQLNNVADLFLEDDPDFALAGDYANLVKTYQFWNLHALIGGEIEKLLDHPLLEVMAVKRRVEDPARLEWSQSNVTEISPSVGYGGHRGRQQQPGRASIAGKAGHEIPRRWSRLFRRGILVFASFRSRNNGEALKVAEKFQGGGHANAAGAILPKSIRNIPDAVEYLRQILNPKRDTPLNSLENLFAGWSSEKNVCR